ncbi:hypothetical protein PRIPAC_77189, partial [Pristionchus pacificus]|uniref:Uncharacterized protein n=1 Tax=Pristionchus pacificus TaxID=54126 RepID=A0A2A6CQB9_PRIPA
VIHRDAAIVEQDYTKVMLRGVPRIRYRFSRFLIDAFDRILKEKTMEGLIARTSPTPSDFVVKLQRKSQKKSTTASLTDNRRLLVIVKAKFFSHSAEQKIKASGDACVFVAQGTITCVVN